MRHNLKTLHLGGFAILMASSLLMSCTKEVPYKYTFKEKVHDKSEVDTKAEFLYVASSDTASQDGLGAAGARPYWQGQEKIVKFRFTEKNLQVVGVHEEERLQDNKLNEKIILEIPVEHVEYRCSEDRYKKCTNQEEKNMDLAWNQKSKFIPDFDGLKSVATSLLPVEMDKVFGDSCYTETASRYLGYELTSEALNIQVLKTFKGDLSCLAQQGISVGELDELETQIVFHHSFTRLDKLASPGYKAVDYPVADEGTFGFFTTVNRKYDVDYTRTERAKNTRLNRFNPERSEVVYYLSDNFNKPEFASIKESTKLAFDKVNAGLETAGIKTRLVLKDPAGKSPGDVRNSMIVMVEDPIAAGPLGYGPSVAHPRTGEILSARTVMYYGNMLQSIKYTYDEVLREIKAEKTAAKKANGDKAAAVAAPNVKPAKAVLAKDLFKQLQSEKSMKTWMTDRLSKKAASDYNAAKSIGKSATGSGMTQLAKGALEKMTKREFDKATLETDRTGAAGDVLSAMSKYCNYPSELFAFDEVVRTGLQGKLGQELKPWESLSNEERQQVIDLIGPQIWLPTLVHELGHNLGLRHNFNGSEDKENFYSKEELAKMGVNHAIPYSSVMDYGYSELNLLPTLGKYDIAALRFAYNREVETADGKVVRVESTIKKLKEESGKPGSANALTLKDYGYCSDEHVEVNPGCKRFDKGTNLSEIVDHMIQSYDEMYERRNKRGERENFSVTSDAGYQGRIRSTFNYMRASMERYESIRNRFNLPEDAKEWQSGWLKDLKDAALKSGRFFIRVLKTPDLHCVIAEKSAPTTIKFIQPIGTIDKGATDCFKDVSLNDQYVMLGQFGKLFNSRKSPKSENHYADQIDVRGIWIDKKVAAEALFNRKIGNSSFDTYQDNYLDMSDLTAEVTATLQGLLFNQITADIVVTDANGDVLLAENGVPHKVFMTPDETKEQAPTHWIEAPLYAGLAKQLGVPSEPVSFQQILLEIVQKNMTSEREGKPVWQTHATENRAFLDKFKIIRTSKMYQLNQDEAKNIAVKDVGSLRLVALPENLISQQLIGTLQLSELLAKLSAADLEKLRLEKAAAAGPTAAPGSAPAAGPGPGAPTAGSAFPAEYAQIPLGFITAYQSKSLPSANIMNYLLTILPASN